ncbi:Rv1733c family protein [Amycolatopsis panacis]|uniref:Transmembrane protein n=1 Tax=Amycolatopsis panacis TaxID=2340917 RepID=A0A419HZC2_9PSEU|nr:hypothetical protein [Amycolatopsis panacis]RJQ82486.1 hypothetical protein D5S19_21825 [Amycolatopsis panacis]
MSSSASRLMRWWRLLVPGRRSVARTSDRIQAALIACAVVLALAAVPFAVTAGSTVYAGQQRISVAQLAARHPATATLLADGPPFSSDHSGGVVARTAPTDATWWAPDGSSRVGRVEAGSGTHRGDTISIWVDRSGAVVAPPLSRTTVLADSFGAALVVWLGVCGALALVCTLAVLTMNRYRYRRWQREWFAEQSKRPHP